MKSFTSRFFFLGNVFEVVLEVLASFTPISEEGVQAQVNRQHADFLGCFDLFQSLLNNSPISYIFSDFTNKILTLL